MLMPETAVHEYDFAAAGKDNIRTAGKVFTMQAESVAKPVDQSAEEDLRISVCAADTPHVGAAPFRAELIHGGLS
jgi:hypothetical protein